MPLSIQDDHSRRMTDISFRHLNGAWKNHNNKQEHIWIKGISNDDSRFGKSEYMISHGKLMVFESEEYTQALATTLFSHVWLLSAANYYRQYSKIKFPEKTEVLKDTSSPQSIATQLCLPTSIIECAAELHGMRNTIMHLVENDKKTAPITTIDFKYAYHIAKVTWVIFSALLRNYGIKPDLGSWRTQTKIYSLPHTLKNI